MYTCVHVRTRVSRGGCLVNVYLFRFVKTCAQNAANVWVFGHRHGGILGRCVGGCVEREKRGLRAWVQCRRAPFPPQHLPSAPRPPSWRDRHLHFHGLLLLGQARPLHGEGAA